MGVLTADTSLTAPIYVSLSNFRLSGRVIISYDKPTLVISLQNEALKNVTVHSSFDGCSAAVTVASSVEASLRKAIKKLVNNPLHLTL